MALKTHLLQFINLIIIYALATAARAQEQRNQLKDPLEFKSSILSYLLLGRDWQQGHCGNGTHQSPIALHYYVKEVAFREDNMTTSYQNLFRSSKPRDNN